MLQKEFGKSFDAVDELWVTDIYPASEKPIPGISGQTIVAAVTENGAMEVHSHPDKNSLHLEIGAKLKEFAAKGLTTVMLDMVADEAEMQHAGRALKASGMF